MRKSEEFVSNKKRFYDSFGPEGDSKDDEEEEEADDGNEKNDENKKEKAEDFNLLFSGNVEGNFFLFFFPKTYFFRKKFQNFNSKFKIISRLAYRWLKNRLNFTPNSIRLIS